MNAEGEFSQESQPASFAVPISALDSTPFRAIHRWLATPPKDLKPDYADFYSLSNYTHAFGLMAHVLFLAIFIALQVKILIYFNIFSVAAFIGTLSASKRGWLNLALLAGGLEVGAHQAVAVLVLGLAPAFHHYVLILAVGTLFYQHIPLRVRIGMAILPVAGYIGMYIYGLHHEPLQRISLIAVDALSAMNIIFYVAILMGICIFYQYSVQKARRHAEKMAQAKTLFLANMSHELRTPLNAILGFAQILQRSDALTTQDQRNLSTINRSGEHLLQLINDILDMSKLEEGKITMQLAPFDLQRLLSDLHVMFSLAARQKQISLDFALSPDLPRAIRGDELRLRQVLINLLSNALKFTSRGGVRLSASVADCSAAGQTRISFRVEDTGEGIAKKEVNDLFKLFTQTKSGRESRRGTGLGLALSQRFVELMGGRIAAESEPGKGSAFFFDLPVDLETSPLAEPAGQSVQVEGVREEGKRHRMLVVDDNEAGRDLLLQLLSGLGFPVDSASDGAAAVAEWERTSPSLIWMDLQMPVMDGNEASRIIQQRAESSGSQAPKIVAITASIQEIRNTPEGRANFDAFVNKPFRESEIYEVLEKLLDVEFLYADPAPAANEPTAAAAANDDNLSLSVAQVDAALLEQLSKASELADFESAQQVIRKIAAKDAVLGARLEEFLESYRFDLLQELTQTAEAKQKIES